jgi:NAD(P) transhydrogenase subunit beta
MFQGAPVVYAGQHLINLMLALAMLGFGVIFFLTQSWLPFIIMTLIAFVLGVLIIIPIGGGDMPVVVSMLNSYSGWAAAGIGFSLNNPMLIIAGSLVGSSGAILSYIMCRAMNRSYFNVILGGFGNEAGAAAAGGPAEQRPVKSGSADDALFMLGNAETVVIVPGYGLAVARAQHALKELTDKLVEKGIEVKYAIHPVAGRMPGHMNAARRSRSAVRHGLRNGRHQRRVRAGRRGDGARRERRGEPGGEERSEVADRGDADHRGLQVAHGYRE